MWISKIASEFLCVVPTDAWQFGCTILNVASCRKINSLWSCFYLIFILLSANLSNSSSLYSNDLLMVSCSDDVPFFPFYCSRLLFISWFNSDSLHVSIWLQTFGYMIFKLSTSELTIFPYSSIFSWGLKLFATDFSTCYSFWVSILGIFISHSSSCGLLNEFISITSSFIFSCSTVSRRSDTWCVVSALSLGLSMSKELNFVFQSATLYLKSTISLSKSSSFFYIALWM